MECQGNICRNICQVQVILQQTVIQTMPGKSWFWLMALKEKHRNTTVLALKVLHGILNGYDIQRVK